MMYGIRKFSMKLKTGALACFVMLVITAGSLSGKPLSLTRAIEKALESNYSIQVINQNERIAEMSNTWGGAGRFPNINFGLSSNNRRDFNDGADVMTNTVTPGVSLDWVLFNGFKIQITKNKLDTLERLSRGNTAILVEQTVQSVIRAYYQALLEQERLAVFEQVMNLSKDRYEHTMMKKEIGSALTFDVLQAKNAWLEDKAVYMQQEVTRSNVLRDIQYFMGETGDLSYELTSKFEAPIHEYEYEALKDKILSNNRNLKNQYVNMMLLEQNISLAKSQYFPSLSLRSGVDAFSTRTKYEDTNASTRRWQDAYVNLTLSYNLFDGGERKRALQIARIHEETGQIETDEMIHSLTNELAKLFDLYEVRKGLYEVALENIEAAELNLKISEDRFRAGTINSFNYRDVQLIYLNAAQGKLQAIYNLIDTDTALARITGGIVTETDDNR